MYAPFLFLSRTRTATQARLLAVCYHLTICLFPNNPHPVAGPNYTRQEIGQITAPPPPPSIVPPPPPSCPVARAHSPPPPPYHPPPPRGI